MQEDFTYIPVFLLHIRYAPLPLSLPRTNMVRTALRTILTSRELARATLEIISDSESGILQGLPAAAHFVRTSSLRSPLMGSQRILIQMLEETSRVEFPGIPVKINSREVF